MRYYAILIMRFFFCRVFFQQRNAIVDSLEKVVNDSSDNMADQFGGLKEKKLKYKALNDLLLANSTKDTKEQLDMLVGEFDKWKGFLEQVDDGLIA